MDLLDRLGWAVSRAWEIWTSPRVAGNAVALLVLLAVTPAFRMGDRWRRYRTPGFRTDVLYTLFYVGGFYAFLVAGPAYRFLGGLVDAQAPFLRLNALSSLPPAAHFVVLYVVMDGLFYVAHRALHASPALWCFHAVHHSQQSLTPLTNFRFHAGEVLFRGLVQFVPGLLLGSPVSVWMPVVWLQTSLEALSHADLDWGYGPLGRVLVSPRFHRIHHSADPRHANRNFSAGLAVWDALFGTADRDPARPRAYGAPGAQVPESFLRQIPFPFVRWLRNRVRAERAPGRA
jgi:sterol desaturase/sphingolipid hydroxylase (fatty acid hydroxylase superfamily)